MIKSEKRESINRLMDKYLEHMNSERNKSTLKLWQNPRNWNRDMWRGVPVGEPSVTPFLIAPDNSLWSKLLDIDMSDYYSNPYSYLEAQLKKRIYQYENFPDDTPLTDELYIWFSVVTELSFFGAKLDFFSYKEPWINGRLIENEEDLERLEIPDFYKSGLAAKIHEFYEVMGELADGRFKVMFPEFSRGPFCIVSHLRGMEDALMDMLTDEDFFLKLMRFVTDSYISWMDERSRFLKEPLSPCKLYNDEVNHPMMNPASYGDMVFPFEKELAKHFGGVKYWHSCGNITPFLEQINRLPSLELLHIGPITSYKDAARILNETTTLDVNLDPVRDVIMADAGQMEKQLTDIANECRNRRFSVRIDNFMPDGALENQIEKILLWQSIAEKVLHNKR